jgi:4-amino-4-deoxy-L-arabinose transferase-like glycosyltransferase
MNSVAITGHSDSTGASSDGQSDPASGAAVAALRGSRATAQRIPLALVIALALAYLLPGLIGHDPWKQDEAYIFSSVYHMLQTGDWVVPYVAGEPFMEKPPLFHLVAAAGAALMSPLVPLHDGARLASGLFVAVVLVAIGWSARRSWGDGHGRGAVLLMLSCLGWVVDAHLMTTDLALTAGFAVALAGFVACQRSLRWGGPLLGTGAGMAFLAKGLIGPGVIGIAAVLLPLLFGQWRSRAYWRQLQWAALAALPWLTIWPTALYLRSPELFQVWFWDNNIGRFLGFSVPYLGAVNEPGFWWKTYPWFLFPLWLFAALAFWPWRRAAWRQPAVQIGAVLSAVMALVLGTSASARPLYALPMAVTLAFVGAGALSEVPRWIERSLMVLGIALGCAATAFFWLVWASLVTSGRVPDWPRLGRWLPLDFALPFSASALVSAAAITLAAVALVVMTRKCQERALVSLCAALTVAWGLAATLWLPWIDAAKSYRAMYQSMKFALPSGSSCVASVDLGESERAMLDYVLKIRTQPEASAAGTRCDALLVESVGSPLSPVPHGMVLAWSGTRPGDARERFDLYVQGKTVAINALR